MLRKHGVESHVRGWYESNKIATLKYQLLLRTSNPNVYRAKWFRMREAELLTDLFFSRCGEMVSLLVWDQGAQVRFLPPRPVLEWVQQKTS